MSRRCSPTGDGRAVRAGGVRGAWPIARVGRREADADAQEARAADRAARATRAADHDFTGDRRGRRWTTPRQAATAARSRCATPTARLERRGRRPASSTRAGARTCATGCGWTSLVVEPTRTTSRRPIRALGALHRRRPHRGGPAGHQWSWPRRRRRHAGAADVRRRRHRPAARARGARAGRQVQRSVAFVEHRHAPTTPAATSPRRKA